MSVRLDIPNLKKENMGDDVIDMSVISIYFNSIEEMKEWQKKLHVVRQKLGDFGYNMMFEVMK